jgi:superfamily II DNA/RNA helicase
MSFDEAIEKGFISDYVLDVQYLTDGDKMKAMVNMIKNNMSWAPMFIYFSNTNKCMKFNKILVENNIKSCYLTGKSTEKMRKKVNELIKNGELVVLCLSK